MTLACKPHTLLLNVVFKRRSLRSASISTMFEASTREFDCAQTSSAPLEKQIRRSGSFELCVLAPAERRRSEPHSRGASSPAKERAPDGILQLSSTFLVEMRCPIVARFPAKAALSVLPGPSLCSTGPPNRQEPRITVGFFFLTSGGFAKLPRQPDRSSVRLSVWNATR